MLPTFEPRTNRRLALALLDFQYLYGDEWPAALMDFHNGRGLQRPTRDRAKAKRLMGPIRKIRNGFKAMPGDLPDLREHCACCLRDHTDYEGGDGCRYCQDCTDCPDSGCCDPDGMVDFEDPGEHLAGCRHLSGLEGD